MIRPATLLFSALLAGPALAAEPRSCSAFQMEVSSEVELFQRPPIAVDAATHPDKALEVEVGRLYQVALQPQQDLKYLAPPKKAPDPAEKGGMLRIVIAEGGSYRVSVDAPAWVDAVFSGKALETADFRSDRECGGPTKIVTFSVPAGAELTLQFIDVDRSSLRLAVTPAPQKVW